MDKGKYVKEMVENLYPEATMVEAMRIWSLPKNKEHLLQEKCDSGEYFGQIKKDGFWYSFNKTENHSYLFSRNESKETGLLTEKVANVPHIQAALDCIPKDTILIGEIYVPGGTSKDTTRIMGCLPTLAIERQKEEGNIHYYIHDIISFNGISMLKMPAIKRYEVLNKLYESFNLARYSFIELAQAYTDNLFERIGQSLEDGEEGMVLKHKDAFYSPGKKPAWSAIKCKKVDYLDVVCMGFEDATKEYTGKELESWQYWEDSEGNLALGSFYGSDKHSPVTKPYYNGWKTSILIGVYNEQNELKSIGTVSSGLTDDMKISITKDPDSYIGEVLKVQCMEIVDGVCRHPIFKGFRIDKNPRECTTEIFS